jgi:hypothetical protein
MSETHECAMSRAGLCGRRVPLHMLMCRPHWFQVPGHIRDAIWATWLGGAGVLDPGYQRAVRDAVAAVRDKIGARDEHGQ